MATPEGHEFIVSLARRSVIREYEGLCEEVGSHAGIVDLATFSLINAVLAGASGNSAEASTHGESPTRSGQDWLLVSVALDSASIAIVRGTDLIFFRNRSADTDGSIADLVHQTAMYHEDHLNGSGFSRVVLAGTTTAPEAADVETIRRSLDGRLTAPIDAIDPRTAAALTDRISASPALLDTLAPLVGLLLRDRASHPASAAAGR